MKKRGFTLIELLVTMTIIAIMALIAIPAFTKYEENATFNSKVAEILSAINQTAVSAQNPGQNVKYYVVDTDTTDKKITISRYDTVSEALVAEKTIESPSIVSSIALSPSSSRYLVLNAGKNFACNQADTTTPCVETNSFNNNYIVINRTSSLKTISVKSNPIRVTVQ